MTAKIIYLILAIHLLGVRVVAGNDEEFRSFADKCAKIWLGSKDPVALQPWSFRLPAEKSSQADLQTGWAHIAFSKAGVDFEAETKKLKVLQIFIREPDDLHPSLIHLPFHESADCIVRPDKIAVVYLCDNARLTRGCLIYPLILHENRIWICPMRIVSESTAQKPSANGKAIPVSDANLSSTPGVTITKVADDMDCYGLKPMGSDHTVFSTDSNGCAIYMVLFKTCDARWFSGLDSLPSGRFYISVTLLPGEEQEIEAKFRDALARAFNLKFSLEENFIWRGYKVKVPGTLPPCFKKTRAAKGSGSWNGRGRFVGYSLEKLFSHVLPDCPVEIEGGSDEERYDFDLETWPEKDGELAALRMLGFEITPTKLPRRTLVIASRTELIP